MEQLTPPSRDVVGSQGMERSEQRWIESEAIKDPEGDNEEEFQEASWVDLFSDPDPLETFHFHFNIDEETDIHISLQGYKAELGQTLASTGLTLWRASSILCDFLVHNRNFVQDKTLVELGAGLGLCGILAKHLGAVSVTLTDGDTDAIANLRSNVARNTTDVVVKQLIWGVPQRDAIGLCDTIIGSDIIYLEEMLEPLWATVNDILAPTGTFLLAFARRNVSIDLVFEKADQFGFTWLMPDQTEEGVIIFRRKSAV